MDSQPNSTTFLKKDNINVSSKYPIKYKGKEHNKVYYMKPALLRKSNKDTQTKAINRYP